MTLRGAQASKVGAARTNHSLDVVRGVAALLVVISHARFYTSMALEHPLDEMPLWERLAFVPTSFGKESVAVFFVLSGFLVGGQVVRHVRADRFDSVDYGVKRLSRLWSVLVPGLIFTAVLDFVMRDFLPTKGDRLFLTSADDSVLGGLCNLSFLMPSRCLPFGSDDSLWSLGYEFWFYILFAALALGGGQFLRRRWVSGAIWTLVGGASLAAFGIQLVSYIPAWLLGVLVAVYVDRRRARGTVFRAPRTMLVVWIGVLVGSMVVSNVLNVPEQVKFIVVGVGSVGLVTALALLDPTPARWRAPFTALAWFGTWSFSIYVFHLPIVKFFVLLLPDAIPPSLTVPAVYGIAVLAVALIYPLYLISEKQMGRWRSVMFAAAGRRPARAAREPHVASPRADLDASTP